MLRLLDGTDLLSFENRCEASATAVLTYSSLMINDVEHFFMYPLAMNVFFVKNIYSVLWSFLISFFFSFELSCTSEFFNTLGINLLSDL